MTDDPKRLLDALEDGELRSLLEAGKSERPDDRQLLALATKIGIAGGLGGAGGAGGAGSGGAAAAKAGTAVKAAGVASTAVKVGLGVKIATAVAVVGAAGTVALVATRPPAAPPPSGSHVALVAPPPSVSATAGEAPRLVREPLPPPSISASAAKTAAPSSSASPSDPEAEVKLLQQAQDALRADPARALAICNEHARKFPNGTVAQEREVIAIEALVKTGQRAAARARADRFAAAYPGSSHQRRIAQILAE